MSIYRRWRPPSSARSRHLLPRAGEGARRIGDRPGMEALFIGQTYIDVTIRTESMPTGDEKAVAHDYAVSFGGNAVTAAFACAKLGIVPDLVTSLADDWLGRMFLDMAAKYAIPVHPRKVRRSSLVLHPAERRQARHPARPRRRLSAPLPDPQYRGMPRPAPRRPSGGRGAALCQALPLAPHPHLARRRRPAQQYARAARLLSTSPSSPNGCASRWRGRPPPCSIT